jgi:polygalacturonase
MAAAPSARAATCDVTAFGAKGDGTTVSTEAIQRAIDACRDQGGGRVVVPSGVFVSGTLRLHSRIELHLETGAVLRGSPRLEDYRLDGRRLGLLYAERVEGTSITGHGTIDGNSDVFMDRTAAKRVGPPIVLQTRQRERFREVASGLGDGPYVPLDRPFQTIIFSGCRDVSLEDVTIVKAPFWAVHFADCDSVRVRGVRLFNDLMVPNGDGIDFTSCRNVVVSDCDIRAGDDALVFTGYSGHHELPGFTSTSRDSENVVVTNCTLQSRSSAIRVGGWDQNSMRNYAFSNIVIHDSNRGIGVFQRGAGSIENVTFTNVVVRTRLHTGDWWGNGEPIHVSAADRVSRAFVLHAELADWLAGPYAAGLTEIVTEARRERGFGDFWGHMLVARGSADVMLEPELATWDFAALKVIVEQAGGRMTRFDGGPVEHGASVLTTNAVLHDEIVARLRAAADAEAAGPDEGA